jgi:hypothetical protein
MILKTRGFCRLAPAVIAGLAMILTLVPVLSSADDRDLLRESAADPYVFILLDLSGSMHWEIGQTLPSLRADAPTSKMYQAKEALFTVVDQLNNVQFGFGTFNQDELRVVSKHWLYEAAEEGVVINTDALGNPLWTYPRTGDEHVFGREWTCVSGGNDDGCGSNDPARLDDSWEARRMQLYSKLGDDGQSTTTFYIRTSIPGNNNKRYRVDFSRVSGTLGDATIEVRVRVRNTNSSSFDESKTVTFNRVQDFLSWDNGAAEKTTNPNSVEGYFSQFSTSGNTENAIATDILADFRPQNTTCFGWEPNDDTIDDDYQGTQLKAPTTGSGETSYGDVIPLNWADDNRDQILDRLAPNRLLGEATPDFSIARYFEDRPTGGELRYTSALRNANGVVLMPEGSTPLGNSIRDFRLWYKEWKKAAATNDTQWGCRKTFLLLLTDGNETCNSNAGGQATALLSSQGIQTYVIGLGVPSSAGGDTLDDIADRGGTGKPFRPESPEELVAVLQDIFEQIREETSTFASAAVPSVQAQVSDKLFLTSFTPISSASVWSGHLDGYLKPLPLTDSGLPDRDRVCAPTDRAACRAWDAGEQLLLQAPEEILDGVTGLPVLQASRLGGGENDRRVVYPNLAAGVPQPSTLFWADSSSGDTVWQDLLFGLGVPFDISDPVSFAAAKVRGEEILRQTLKVKREKITQVDENGVPQQVDEVYALGDIFHSDPLVISNPNDFFLFNTDRYGNGKACDDSTDPNPGYRCFFERQVYRRKQVFFGSNDGQLHAFDAGILRETLEANGEVTRRFDNGTGRETFAVVPRATMREVVNLADNLGHRYTVDGPPVYADVFIDPQHNGTPIAADREWRSAIFGGLREGGRAVYALDVTQPDVLTNGIDSTYTRGNIPQPLAGSDAAVTDYVPSCWQGGAGCGTLRYPEMLWEFDDTVAGVPRDDDGNGFPDLGDTWSIPTVGLVKVRNGLVVEDRFAVIFGGGVDPSSGVPVGAVGNFLYMVDAETGELLYKRPLFGATPSQVAVVDLDLDLYLDTLYVGTTAGFLYKADLSTPAQLDAGGQVASTETAWDPFPIFNTGGRPIYFPPSVFFNADTGNLGLSFGTGNREDLWEPDGGLAGRYYIFLDNGLAAGASVLTEASLAEVNLADNDATNNLLTSQGGWYFPLGPEERLITKSLTIAGVTFFTTFIPQDGVPAGGGNDLCARLGDSRVFVVNTTNGNGFAPPPADPSETCANGRCMLVPEFVTNPFVDQGTTKNVVTDTGARISDVIDDSLRAVMESIKGLMPDDCRFSAHTQNLKTIRSDTGVVFIAPIPTCIVQHGWAEEY